MTRTAGVALRASAVTVASVLPVFLAGGVAVQMRHELGFSPAGLGFAISLYYAASALAAVPAGRFVRRLGAAVTGRFAVALAAAAMIAIATVAHRYAVLCALLTLAAVSNAVGQISSNQLLARGIPAGRQGIAFAVKQAALPGATLLAGVAVPAVAVTVGWRWAFALAAALGAATLAVIPRDPPAPVAPRRAGPRDPALLMVAVGGGLAAASANCLGTFLVDSTVAQGSSAGRAGLTLTLGSVLCIGARLAGGVRVDRRAGRPLRLVAGLLAVGAGGLMLLAAARPAALVAGVALAFGCGWAWPGLLNYAVVRRYPESPAEATSVTQSGVYVGGCAGPLLFGALAARSGYPAAWAAGAAVMLAAGAVLFLADRAGRRPADSPAPIGPGPRCAAATRVQRHQRLAGRQPSGGGSHDQPMLTVPSCRPMPYAARRSSAS